MYLFLEAWYFLGGLLIDKKNKKQPLFFKIEMFTSNINSILLI